MNPLWVWAISLVIHCEAVSWGDETHINTIDHILQQPIVGEASRNGNRILKQSIDYPKNDRIDKWSIIATSAQE